MDRVVTRETSGSACGKVILLGEHAVVYGVPAIAVGIDRGARASAARLDEGPSRLRVAAWEVDVTEADANHDLARAFALLLGAVRNEQERASAPYVGGFQVEEPVVVDVAVDLPPGGGLGCSAAIGVAVARALAPEASASTIESLVMAWESVFHGNPSGIDAAVCARGGCLMYQRGDLPKIEPVAVKGGLTLCVGSTGIASSTKSMVEAVAQRKERRPEIVDKAFEGISALVRNARLAIEDGDRFALGRLMDLNQMLLSGLFVSSEEIEIMCDLARSAGALGAKLTGAGGGGSVVALVNGMAGAERVLSAWKKSNFDGFAARVAPSAPETVLAALGATSAASGRLA
jgi:mevalonate kinase